MITINPEHVAAKFNFVRSENADASAGELVWFIQAMSMRPGGVEAFIAGMVDNYPAEFQTTEMREAGDPPSGSYTLAQCLVVWQAFSRRTDPLVRKWSREKAEDLTVDEVSTLGFADLLTCFVGNDTTIADAEGDNPQAAALQSAYQRFNYSWMRENCTSLARQDLPRLLADYCQESHLSLRAPIYCPNLLDILRRCIERHAEDGRAQLVQTVVTRTIFSEMRFAYSESVPVRIVGESRFGKTKSVAGWCQAYPGRARLVTVPDSGREVDFMRAHADALGIDYTPATPAPVLKDKVEFVLRRSGLMVVYDEAHYLIPQNYHKTTAPSRLNWVRQKVIDQGVPCAFFATPQSYKQTLEKYVETTGYQIEQWLGRMAPTVILSEVIPFEEIVAIARQHFPEIPEVLLEEIADRAILADGHLKNVELTGRRARFLAREREHSIPTRQDVMDAIDAMMPTAPRVVTAKPEPAVESPQPKRSTRPAAARQQGSGEEFSRRGTNAKTLIPVPALVE